MANLENRVMGLDGKMYEQIIPANNDPENKATSINTNKKIETGTIMDGINNDLSNMTDSEVKLTSENSIDSANVQKLDEATIQRLMAYRNRKPSVREYKKIGRNDLCPCGSGKKYKNCCLKSGRFEGLVKK